MFDRFIAGFVRDAPPVGPRGDDKQLGRNIESESDFITGFFQEIGGASFGNGVYRTLSRAGASAARDEVAEAFPGVAGRTVPIGRDWLNRIFAVDHGRLIDQVPGITIFSHFTDEIFELPANIDTFHNVDLVSHSEELLQVHLFRDFMQINHLEVLPYTCCASFEHPLFLGGDYAIENMRLVDASVDWAVTTQMLVVARNLNPGDAL